jgi:hypothetical protein
MADGVLRELKTGTQGEVLKIVGGCPVRAIREILEDGSEVYLGDIYISRCLWPYIVDEHERDRLKKENESREIGDSEIFWTFGGAHMPGLWQLEPWHLNLTVYQITWHQAIMAEVS